MAKLWKAAGLVLLVGSSAFGAGASAQPQAAAATPVSKSPTTRPTAALAVSVPVGVGKVTVAIPFEKDVANLEAAFRKAGPAGGGILFYGSSSIRLWKSLKEDFPGLNVLNHGFGGSTAPDALRFAERLVLPAKPSTIIFYEGDNDLSKGRTPEQLLADYQSFEKLVHAKLPTTKIIYLSVKPSPKRVDLMASQRKANAMLEAWIKGSKDNRLSFVDVFGAMLDPTGKPRAELFGADKLHMNRDGYKLWTTLIGLPKMVEDKAKAVLTGK